MILRGRKGKCIAVLALFGALLLGPLSAFAEQEVRLPFAVPKNPRQLEETALVKTSKGSFEIAFYRDVAPVTVASFQDLAKKGFYKGLKFHRYVPGFVIQGGDPLGTGEGGPGYTLPPEFSDTKHRRGTLGMARRPSPVNPERRSNGSQFYICIGQGAPHLDGLYTVFAQVINGMDTVLKLRGDDEILEIKFPKR